MKYASIHIKKTYFYFSNDKSFLSLLTNSSPFTGASLFMLRDYQQKAITDIQNAFKSHKRVLFQLGTGGGKTFIFSTIVSKIISHNPNKRILILTHRSELHKQTDNTLNNVDVKPYLIDENNKNTPICNGVFVGKIETVCRRVKKLGLFDIIIIDEAHIGNFRKIFEHYPKAYYLGLTATPIASNKKHPLNEFYNTIICGPTTQKLIDQGFLCSFKYYVANVDTQKLKTKNGEFDQQQLHDLYNSSKIYDGIIKYYNERSLNKKTIIFCCNIDHTVKTCEIFNNSGFICKYITSKTSQKEKESILKWFKDTPNAILSNCGILTTGFDEPTIESIILNRATKSLALFNQMVGRGSRPIQGIKDNCICIDLGNNIARHGRWEEFINWEEIFYNPGKLKERAKGLIAQKHCAYKDCGCIIPASAQVCEYCEREQPVKSKIITDGNLELLEPVFTREPIDDGTVNYYVELSNFEKERKKFNPKYATYISRKILYNWGYSALKEYASKMNYNHYWIKKQCEIIGFSKK